MTARSNGMKAVFAIIAACTILIVIVYYHEEAHWLFKSVTGRISGSCAVPPSGYKAWKNGLITVLKPEIPKDCQKLFDGDLSETWRIQFQKAKWNNQMSDEDFLQATANCSWVQDYFSNNLYVTKVERSFPIAFSFLIYNSLQQIVRLLKVLYRPHNQYCLHPDAKSNPVFIKTFTNIANCLSNVHVSSRLHKVQWGHYSIMESQMHCLWDLVQIRKKQSKEEKWKYVINLCGKELPLNTNHDIVSHLIRLNGSSAIDAYKMGPSDRNEISRLRNKRIPFGFPYYKSMTYMAISFEFANFLFTNSTAIQVYEFFKGCAMPEEHYYATLYMLPNIPGGFNPNIPKHYYFETDSYFWRSQRDIRKRGTRCIGDIVHRICIVRAGDMSRVLESTKFGERALFHNKYFMENDHTIMDCMEERIVAKNKLEFEGDCYHNSAIY